MRLKAIISYKGTGYYGYQLQTKTNEITIQEVIQNVLYRIFQKEIIIYSSGRTDRGVHALGQVIHFDIDEDRDLGKLRWSINSLLPKDIHFNTLEKVDDSFHARYSVSGKKYRYIVNKGEHDVLHDDLLYNYHRDFDLDILSKAIKLFIGEHNFINFCSNDEGNFVRIITDFTLEVNNDLLTFEIKGNGFRRYMVRMIIGTCLAASLGKISLEEIENKLSLKDNIRTRFKAPSCGLYLVEVYY